MDIALAASRLQSLAANDAKRPKTAVLRDVFPEIERAIDVGVSRAAILRELRALGLEMSASTFATAIRRLRSEQAAPRPRRVMADLVDSSPGPLSERRSFCASTVSGSLYDVDALSRLLRASQPLETTRWAGDMTAER